MDKIHRKVWKKESLRSLVPGFHQICSVRQNHPFGHGQDAPTNLLLVTFLTQNLVQTAKIIRKPDKTSIILLL
jgi:hypothetical protein